MEHQVKEAMGVMALHPLCQEPQPLMQAVVAAVPTHLWVELPAQVELVAVATVLMIR